MDGSAVRIALCVLVCFGLRAHICVYSFALFGNHITGSQSLFGQYGPGSLLTSSEIALLLSPVLQQLLFNAFISFSVVFCVDIETRFLLDNFD